MQHQHPASKPLPEDAVAWRDTPLGRVPVSRQFDDPYYSLDDGLAETRHVFIDGNDLCARFTAAPATQTFHVAELGFGTGLNFLVACAAWQAAGGRGRLHFTSFEAYPLAQDDMASALTVFPELASLAAPLIDAWSPGGDITLAPHPGITLNVLHGDARDRLGQWDGCADAWFLDGFSPAKNPQMWDATLLAQVGARTVICGTAATYTAAGHVRRALGDAGFAVTRVPGYGRKRHMTRAIRIAAPDRPIKDHLR